MKAALAYMAQIGLLHVLALFLSVYIPRVDAVCANACSGHGTCGASNICTCYTGWNGGAPDCSRRECPYGTAWADKAYAVDKAHLPAQCSNAGKCNYETGNCECFEGFTGSACQRSACPNSCSGHGSCMTIADLSYWRGADYDPETATVGDGKGVVYNNWDKNSILMCDCDGGYFGADCSQAMCAKGDDPMTINQNFRSIKLTVYKTSGYFSGSIGFNFQGVTTFLSLSSPSASDCITSLQSSPQIGTVGCTVSFPSALSIQYTLVFYSWPTNAKSNNLYFHDGNPLLREFLCDISQASSDVTCAWGDVVNTNVIEWEYCSNRGICDFSTGLCACNDGFGGSACSNQTYSHAVDGGNALPGFQINVAGHDFLGDALQITTEKSPAPDFFLIEAIAGGQRVFDVRGDGVATFTGFISHTGGQTIASGGLYVTTAGMTIAEDGMSVSSSSQSTSAATIASTYAGSTAFSTYSALKVTSASSLTHNLITGINQGTTNFAVRNDGRTSISGGLLVTGGISVYSSGITVTGGITVSSGSVNIPTSSGLTADKVTVGRYGLAVLQSGIQVYSGGINIIAGGLRVKTGYLTSNTGVSITAGGLTVSTGGVNIRADGLQVTGGLTVHTGTLRVAVGGVSVTAGGLTVQAGGLSVTAGGTQVQALTAAGLITASAGLTSASGLSVTAGAVTFGAGLTVSAGDLSVTIGTTAVQALTATTLSTSSTLTSAGLITASAGLTSASGLSVTSGASQVQALTATGLITASGGILIGGTTLTSTAVATGTAGATTYWLTTSDRRLKRDLSPVVDSLDKIRRLKSVYFYWSSDAQKGVGSVLVAADANEKSNDAGSHRNLRAEKAPSPSIPSGSSNANSPITRVRPFATQFDDRRHIGFIAQDVQGILPEAVAEMHGDQYLGIDYSAIVPVLVDALKEVDARQSEYAKEVAALKEQVRVLREENDEIRQKLRKE